MMNFCSILSWVGMGGGEGGHFFLELNLVDQSLMLWWILFQPPHVSCETKIWHPNISENGEVCLRYGQMWFWMLWPSSLWINASLGFQFLSQI